MELQQLRYFTKVAQLKNFTRAAEACRVAQPSLSQQIQKLERELGGPVFHRQGRRIVLTELGSSLLPRAEKMLQLHEDALRLAQEQGEGGGKVSFGAILTMAPYLIPYVVGRSEKTVLPEFEVVEDFTDNLLRRLREGELDFAIMSTPIEEPGMLVRVLAREPFVVVLPAGHKLARRKVLDLDTVYSEPFLPLSRIHCAGQQISDLCQLSQRCPRTVFQSTQIETILRLVVQGGGVTILPRMALIGSRRKDVVVRPLKDTRIERDIALIHHQDRYLGKAARSMIACIESSLQQMAVQKKMA